MITNKKLYQRVKDYLIVASHEDGKVTELSLIKDLMSEVVKLEEMTSNKQKIYEKNCIGCKFGDNDLEDEPCNTCNRFSNYQTIL